MLGPRRWAAQPHWAMFSSCKSLVPIGVEVAPVIQLILYHSNRAFFGLMQNWATFIEINGGTQPMLFPGLLIHAWVGPPAQKNYLIQVLFDWRRFNTTWYGVISVDTLKNRVPIPSPGSRLSFLSLKTRNRGKQIALLCEMTKFNTSYFFLIHTKTEL